MNRGTCRRTALDRLVTSISPQELAAALGPAEAQYAEDLVLAPQNVTLTCGGTLVNDGAADESPGANFMGYTMAWNDLSNETGYRLELDFDSATFVSEDTPYFQNPNDNARTIVLNTPKSNLFVSMRVIAHVGHDPASHGSDPIPGDVVSNTCTIELVPVS